MRLKRSASMILSSSDCLRRTARNWTIYAQANLEEERAGHLTPLAYRALRYCLTLFSILWWNRNRLWPDQVGRNRRLEGALLSSKSLLDLRVKCSGSPRVDFPITHKTPSNHDGPGWNPCQSSFLRFYACAVFGAAACSGGAAGLGLGASCFFWGAIIACRIVPSMRGINSTTPASLRS